MVFQLRKAVGEAIRRPEGVKLGADLFNHGPTALRGPRTASSVRSSTPSLSGCGMLHLTKKLPCYYRTVTQFPSLSRSVAREGGRATSNHTYPQFFQSSCLWRQPSTPQVEFLSKARKCSLSAGPPVRCLHAAQNVGICSRSALHSLNGGHDPLRPYEQALLGFQYLICANFWGCGAALAGHSTLDHHFVGLPVN